MLKKRDALRKAFDNFEIKKVAKYDDKKIAALMKNEDIIQNEPKIRSVVNNAQCALTLVDEVGFYSLLLSGCSFTYRTTTSVFAPQRTIATFSSCNGRYLPLEIAANATAPPGSETIRKFCQSSF